MEAGLGGLGLGAEGWGAGKLEARGLGAGGWMPQRKPHISPVALLLLLWPSQESLTSPGSSWSHKGNGRQRTCHNGCSSTVTSRELLGMFSVSLDPSEPSCLPLSSYFPLP